MKIINILLTLAVIGVGFLLFRTINEPIVFNRGMEQRQGIVKEKLKYIRDLQIAHKDLHGKFSPSFDSLRIFVETDSLKLIKVIGDPDKVDVEVKYVTTWIPAKDSLTNSRFALDKLAAIPNVEGEQFSIQIAETERGRIMVPLFLVEATYPQVFKGLNKKYIDPYATLSVGSLTDPTYNGNWEGN